jgi:hypothetical protein
MSTHCTTFFVYNNDNTISLIYSMIFDSFCHSIDSASRISDLKIQISYNVIKAKYLYSMPDTLKKSGNQFFPWKSIYRDYDIPLILLNLINFHV